VVCVPTPLVATCWGVVITHVSVCGNVVVYVTCREYQLVGHHEACVRWNDYPPSCAEVEA
jgi:hypothetical protein